MKVRRNCGRRSGGPSHCSGKRKDAEGLSRSWRQVGLHPQDAFRYAHEFSGGQRQRIGIARAISLNPELVVADEPVSALDVSIQAQILNLLMDLRDQLGLTYLFISHDLRVVKYVSNRIAVMYMGKIVEMANSEDLFRRPLHPYTQVLLKAIPKLDLSQKRETPLLKEEHPPLPSARECLFQARCPHSREKCQTEEPVLLDEGEDHFVACHFIS